MKYVYDCPNCGALCEREAAVEARNTQICECGATLERRFDASSVQINIPEKFANTEAHDPFTSPEGRAGLEAGVAAGKNGPGDEGG